MPSISLERFAELLALTKHFGARGDEALVRSGVEPTAFREAESKHTGALVEIAKREEVGGLNEFGAHFARERARLRLDDPAIESLGALPAPTAAVTEEQGPPTEQTGTERAAAALADGVRTETPSVAPVGGALDLPTYLAKLGKNADEVNVDETLPIWGTVSPKPATPFSGATSPQRLAELKSLEAPLAPIVISDDVDQTVMVRSPLLAEVPRDGSFAEKLTPPAIPVLSVDEYARFRALLTVHGEDHEPTWRSFGILSRVAKDALQTRFASYFQRDRAAQERFVLLIDQHITKLKPAR